MSNGAKTIATMTVGAVLGAGICIVSEQSVSRAPDGAKDEAVNRVVNIGIDAANNLTADHDPVVVRINRGDQVVWTSEQFNNFVVCVVSKERNDPGQPQGPSNPFSDFKTENTCPGGVEGLTTTTGQIESGKAKGGAKGNIYKFTIEVTKDDGSKLVLDPHVVFD